MGNSQELVDELCAWLDSEGYTLRSKWPKGEPNPYGKHFIGQSYLADVGGGVINVTFEARCRNNWHGAAKDSWFQHLTYHRDAQEGASNEWLELWKNRSVRG